MIKRYYRVQADADLATLDKDRPNTWIHVEAPSKDDISELVQRYDLEQGHLEDSLDEDEMPRFEVEGSQIYAFIRIAIREKSGEYETFPLLLALTENTLVTVCAKHLSALEGLTSGSVPFETTDRMKLILFIMQRITQQYDQLIDKTSRKIKAVRQRLRTHAVRNEDFVDFVIIEDELNEFLSALQPNNAVLRRLLVGRKLAEEDQDLVEDVLLMNEQSIENCNDNIRSIIGVRDAHSSISDNSLNQTMKVLTVATLAMAIPNMFFGIYSMNIVTPFQQNANAFFIIVGFTLFVTATVLFIGRKKRIF